MCRAWACSAFRTAHRWRCSPRGAIPRVKAVVAFEPFSSAETRRAGTHARGIRRARRRGISDRQFAAAHVKQARVAGFDWADADIPAALADARARRCCSCTARRTLAVARSQPHAVQVRAGGQQARAGAERQSRDTSVADRAVRIGGDRLVRRGIEASLVAVIPLQSFRGGLCISWLGGILENPARHRCLGATGQRRGAHAQDHGT